jgi:hypothetical protein
MRLRLALLLALALPTGLCASLALAEQARYYWWQGKHQTLCAQTSPGKGWTRLSGAFVKSDCSI